MVIPLGMVYLNPLKRGMRIVLLKNVFSGSISEIWWAITDKRDFGVADGDPHRPIQRISTLLERGDLLYIKRNEERRGRSHRGMTEVPGAAEEEVKGEPEL